MLNSSARAKLWNYTALVGGVECSPAVVNGVVYFSAVDNNFYALHASTGAKLWNTVRVFGGLFLRVCSPRRRQSVGAICSPTPFHYGTSDRAMLIRKC